MVKPNEPDGAFLVSIQFEGENLEDNGVPIYPLGNSFIHFQRMVNKAYSYQRHGEQELFHKNPYLNSEQRQRLSLQISERRKGSDIYDLIPFLADNLEFVTQTASNAFSLLAYLALYRHASTKNTGQIPQMPVAKIAPLRFVNPQNKMQFINEMKKSFNLSEIKELCQAWEIDDEDLSGDSSKSSIITALIQKFQQLNRLSDLYQYCNEKRPRSNWPQLSYEHIEADLLKTYGQEQLFQVLPSLLKDVEKINQTIDGTTIKSIQLSFSHPIPLGDYQVENIYLDSETKDYIAYIMNEPETGNKTTLSGRISKLFYRTYSGEFRTDSQEKIKLQIPETLFSNIREIPRNYYITFEGIPIYYFGLQSQKINEFAVQKIINVKEPEPEN